MAKVVVMPKLGLTMTEGEVVKWHKAEGEQVNVGDALFDVATDKLTNEVEASESGILRKILINEHQSIACLEPVAIIAAGDENIDSFLPRSKDEKTEGSKPESVVEKKKLDSPKMSSRLNASPIAKRLATQHHINLSQVIGTGPNGRIIREDVEAYIEQNRSKVKASPMAEKMANQHQVDLTEISKDTRIMKQDVLDHLKEKNRMEDSPQETRIPLTQMRKVISSRMSESWRISPAVTFDVRVDVTKLQEIRKQLREIQRISFTGLLVKLVSAVLLEFPYVNSSLVDNEIVTRNYTNIGVAVALEGGLVVPVIKQANTKGLAEISNEMKELAEKARNNELTTEHLTGGTFTITNLGMYGIESFSPIINQPEVAILGVNTTIDTPIVVNGEIVIKPLMNLSLTADHRVIDGAVAAQFMARLKQYIEQPEILLL
ncbi:dihydrolipoamide acetyltransferase family protein [Bacillus tuaregi]|uniref:dihydrolipoamide acetyltransferase family protein n=1 Tax=Bacillus tuaregi TaxID=1816695 RepID=UPI0008F7F379|nr:dihydrolipoamide acetyltransferase family protein [Bacillus tuaregi]